MKIPLRLKYSIEGKDSLYLKEAKKIESDGFISLKERNYKMCSCGTKIHEDEFSDDQLFYCNCEKRIRKENFKETNFLIDKVNYGQIIKSLKSKLEPIGCTFLKSRRLFRFNKKPIYVVIPEISSYNFVLTQNGGKNCLFVLLDEEKNKPKLLQQWKNRQWYITDFLEEDPERIKQMTEAIATDLKIEDSLEDEFDSLMKKSPHYFEQKFIPYFLDQLKSKNSDLQSYLLNLKLNSEDLTNSKVVVLGGPSSSDFYIINLCQYLSDGLKPEKYGEVKRYNTSKFTLSDYGNAVVRSNEGSNLMIVSTDDIQKGCWVRIIESMRTNKYFKNVLIDKDLILLLLKILKIDIIHLEKEVT